MFVQAVQGQGAPLVRQGEAGALLKSRIPDTSQGLPWKQSFVGRAASGLLGQLFPAQNPPPVPWVGSVEARALGWVGQAPRLQAQVR